MASINERMEQTAASAHEVGRKVSALTETAGEQLAAAAGQAQEATKEQLDKLSSAIRRKPIQSASIAAGVGFLLALIARR